MLTAYNTWWWQILAYFNGGQVIIMKLRDLHQLAEWSSGMIPGARGPGIDPRLGPVFLVARQRGAYMR